MGWAVTLAHDIQPRGHPPYRYPNNNGASVLLTIQSSGSVSLMQSGQAQTPATSLMATVDEESLTASIPIGATLVIGY